MINTIRGVVSATHLLLNTVFWCTLLYIFALLRLILPFHSTRNLCAAMITQIAELWIACNRAGLATLQNITWTVRGLETLNPERSYLVCANHQSWTDIVILQTVFNRRIPFLRFFIKQELIYVPLLGLAWQALDFPRMKRHSKEFLEKHPEKRGEDLATTRRFCERLRGKRISVLNFLEGTRFSRSKHARQQSPYKNLLKPKTGGLAFVIETMGDQFHSLLDVTIYYPAGAVELWGLLSGGLKEAVVEVREIPIPKDLIGGSYLEDAKYRERMQQWVADLWQRKDHRLSELKGEA